jgi:hypothetical protein
MCGGVLDDRPTWAASPDSAAPGSLNAAPAEPGHVTPCPALPLPDYEFEVNAANALWDLMLVRPYRNGAPAVHNWESVAPSEPTCAAPPTGARGFHPHTPLPGEGGARGGGGHALPAPVCLTRGPPACLPACLPAPLQAGCP